MQDRKSDFLHLKICSWAVIQQAPAEHPALCQVGREISKGSHFPWELRLWLGRGNLPSPWDEELSRNLCITDHGTCKPSSYRRSDRDMCPQKEGPNIQWGQAEPPSETDLLRGEGFESQASKSVLTIEAGFWSRESKAFKDIVWRMKHFRILQGSADVLLELTPMPDSFRKTSYQGPPRSQPGEGNSVWRGQGSDLQKNERESSPVTCRGLGPLQDLRQLINTMLRWLCAWGFQKGQRAELLLGWESAQNPSYPPTYMQIEASEPLPFTGAPISALGADPTNRSFIWGAYCFNFMLHQKSKSTAQLRSMSLSQKFTPALLMLIAPKGNVLLCFGSTVERARINLLPFTGWLINDIRKAWSIWYIVTYILLTCNIL